MLKYIPADRYKPAKEYVLRDPWFCSVFIIVVSIC